MCLVVMIDVRFLDYERCRVSEETARELEVSILKLLKNIIAHLF